MMKIFCAIAVTAICGLSSSTFAFDDGPFVQTGPSHSTPPANLANPRNGDVAVPTGPNFINTRDGTVYVPTGPNGVIDTRSGKFIPRNF